VQVDSIFSQGDLVAVLQWLLLDSRFVDKRAVRASKVVNGIAIRRFYKFGVMPGNVLIVQYDISVAFPAYKYFGCGEGEDILLSVDS
jgi:hypothetical protein